MNRIAVFYGGKLSNHLVALKHEAKKMGVELRLFSYNQIYFDSIEAKIRLRDGLTKSLRNNREYEVNDFEVLFFRTAKKHWQEVSWLVDEALKLKKIIVDPIVSQARPTDACKAYQLLRLAEAGLPIPLTLYGSIGYLKQVIKTRKKEWLTYPLVVKGSGGHRGGSVYKIENESEMDDLLGQLRRIEIEEGRRYMVQKFVPNKGDYRVIVLGNRVLGAMKRTAQTPGEFRNNFSMGGKVELAKLSPKNEELCVKAAKACGLMIAGVDMVLENGEEDKPMFWEVNRGPQFKGFMQATGINVPRELVKFLAELENS